MNNEMYNFKTITNTKSHLHFNIDNIEDITIDWNNEKYVITKEDLDTIMRVLKSYISLLGGKK